MTTGRHFPAWPTRWRRALAVCDLVEFGLEHGWSAACERERHTLVGLRHTPQAREKLSAFLKK
ncbi:MAG: hypothetical protein RLZZ217_1078 [Planctomycetota bacterium]